MTKDSLAERMESDTPNHDSPGMQEDYDKGSYVKDIKGALSSEKNKEEDLLRYMESILHVLENHPLAREILTQRSTESQKYENSTLSITITKKLKTSMFGNKFKEIAEQLDDKDIVLKKVSDRERPISLGLRYATEDDTVYAIRYGPIADKFLFIMDYLMKNGLGPQSTAGAGHNAMTITSKSDIQGEKPAEIGTGVVIEYLRNNIIGASKEKLSEIMTSGSDISDIITGLEDAAVKLRTHQGRLKLEHESKKLEESLNKYTHMFKKTMEAFMDGEEISLDTLKIEYSSADFWKSITTMEETVKVSSVEFEGFRNKAAGVRFNIMKLHQEAASGARNHLESLYGDERKFFNALKAYSILADKTWIGESSEGEPIADQLRNVLETEARAYLSRRTRIFEGYTETAETALNLMNENGIEPNDKQILKFTLLEREARSTIEPIIYKIRTITGIEISCDNLYTRISRLRESNGTDVDD